MATIQTQNQTEETRVEPTPPRAHRRLTIERAREIVAKNNAVAVILAPHDGPVTQPKGTPKR